ncbi:hypothetical protein BG006_006155 [Podila minutissima]|uniref:Peptidase M48 domain-containing protein n=1 Tax=Podila minutissima TaxID=64525 RepID=A0A9P5SUI5_9FUNG|nr:hypothetical protein BG006_006155 [Podila minutissima]
MVTQLSIPRTMSLVPVRQFTLGQSHSNNRLASKLTSRILVSNKRRTNRYFTLASKWNKDVISLAPKLKLRSEVDNKFVSAHFATRTAIPKDTINWTTTRAFYSVPKRQPGLWTLSPTMADRSYRLQQPLQQLWHSTQRAGFHSSRPNHALPLIPAAIFTLKTPVTAVVLRMISRASLTLLPLSAKQSPRIILTLVAIPPICFGIVIFAGLEAAPNTGRWRFLFTNEQEELDLLKDEIPSFLETIQVIEDEDDPRVKLVKHILQNLLSTSIEQDGSTLRTGIVKRLEKKHEEAQKRLAVLQKTESQSPSAASDSESVGSNAIKAIVSTNGPLKPAPAVEEDEDDEDLKAMTFEERPFQIFVAKDDAINAFSLGPPRLIFINSGLMEWLENDEDLIAAVVAHELAHVIQRHTMETHGRETVMLFLAVSIPLGPWFNSWVDKTTNDLLHFTASGPLHQAIEVEADTVSLTLMALAGYDPMHAVRLWEQWAEKDQKEIEEEDSAEVHKWTDWMYDHPPSAERARYLKEAVMPARDMWEKVLKRRREPMKRFLSLESRLKGHVDEDGDFVDATVQDVMETMDELLKKQEEDEREQRRNSGVRGTLRRWAKWRPWSSSENVNMGTVEPEA